MPETPTGYVDIRCTSLTDHQATILVLAGMFTRDGEVLVITPRGSKWLKGYCEEQAIKLTGMGWDKLEAMVDA